MQDTGRTIRHTLRLLARAPGFATTAILTLGIGIGACTAIYTVVHAVLLAPLRYPESNRLVHLWQVNRDTGRGQFSDPNFQDVQAGSRSFEALAQYAAGRAAVLVDGLAVRARLVHVSRGTAAVLRVQPFIGRWFVPEEQRPGGVPAAVVSHAFWERHLGSSRDLSRHALTFDGASYGIAGVMPRDVRFPGFDADVWVPRELRPPLPSRSAHNWRVIGRLADGVTVEQASAEVRAVARRLKQEHGEGTWMEDVVVVPLLDELVGRSRTALLVLLGGAAFLLIVACANVVNLLLARAIAREREVAVCAALGASRRQLMLPFVVEAGVLAAAGAALGVVLARAAVGAWVVFDTRGLPRVDEIAVSWPALAFAGLAAAPLAIALGMVAGWRVTRQAGDALRQGGRTAGASQATARLRSALLVAQIATSLVLLVGAGLLAQSVFRLLDEDPGFRRERVVAMDLDSEAPEGEGAPQRLARFHDEVIARLRALPGVIAAGGVNAFPLGGGASNGRFIILTPAAERLIDQAIARCGTRLTVCGPEALDVLGPLFGDSANAGDAEYRLATDGYFRAMGIPLVRGRLFDDRDDATASHAAVVSETLARTRWPGADPIGARVEFGNMDGILTPFTIVGIVGDVREFGLDAAPRPTIYASARQRPDTTATFTVAIHTTAEPDWLAARAREIVRQLNPSVPAQFRTIEEVVTGSIADRRAMLILLAGFAVGALLLAAVGIYGAISYAVTQRAREIGVRVALGAQPADIGRLVLGHAMRVVLAGLTIGAAVAVASSRVLATLLYSVTPTDPVTYGAVAFVLGSVALVAAVVPAGRAMRVEPVVALRTD